MAYVPIHKDLKRIKTKVVFNLTFRQLIGFMVAGALGAPAFILVRKYVPNDVAMVVLILITMPVFFVTFFEKDGMNFETYFKYVYLHKFYQPKKRVKKDIYIKQQRVIAKQTKAIEQLEGQKKSKSLQVINKLKSKLSRNRLKNNELAKRKKA